MALRKLIYINSNIICKGNEQRNRKSSKLSTISEELDIRSEKKDSIKNGYEYETEFMKLSQQMNRILLKKSLGEVSSNRNKKNFTLVSEKSK
jgi:hypothetical protein